VDADDVTIVAPDRQLLPHAHTPLSITYRRDVDVGGGVMFDAIWSDVRHALRTLQRSPKFASIAVLTLALGIGANTAIFSVVNGILLKPLPFSDAEELVGVWHSAPGQNITNHGKAPSQ
jgi:hypothetical protein